MVAMQQGKDKHEAAYALGHEHNQGWPACCSPYYGCDSMTRAPLPVRGVTEALRVHTSKKLVSIASFYNF